jgi:hypothetical protein
MSYTHEIKGSLPFSPTEKNKNERENEKLKLNCWFIYRCVSSNIYFYRNK